MYPVIDMEKCDRTACDSRKCRARAKCPTKAIWQPDPGDQPYLDVGRCTGCRKCLPACPVRAIMMV
ncbi:MAG: 4Fe-4S binding protein [Dehalococcoidia bacterium]|nr:4Fe-4S binding protein [Dehalococcoidia bacterium]